MEPVSMSEARRKTYLLEEKIDRLQNELVEAKAELQRHHRDFTKISGLCDTVLVNCAATRHSHSAEAADHFEETIKEIRNIVG